MCWLLSAVGVVCILVAHEHYSVDVVVGYFVTTRLFWWYHSMANRQVGVTSRQLVCYLVTWNVLVHYYFFPCWHSPSCSPPVRSVSAHPTTTSPTPGGTRCSTSWSATWTRPCRACTVGPSAGRPPAWKPLVRSTPWYRAHVMSDRLRGG